MKKRPYILTIAGFDPSSGAGLTADVKTIEAMKGYGLAVCTATTIQNDIEFAVCHWIAIEVIKQQIDILFDRFEINFVKIGIIQNWKLLNEIVDLLLKKNDAIKIALDPILRSSSDFEFHASSANSSGSDFDQHCIKDQFEEVLDKIYLLTPNYIEIEKLYDDKTIKETIEHIRTKTNLLLKGGHIENNVGKDQLFTVEGKEFTLQPKNKNASEKHGSGCVLSSAITTQLALGFPLLKACFRAKRYTEKVLSSNKTLLGYHNR